MCEYKDPRTNTYSLIKFQKLYGTEEACEKKLFKLKFPEGYKCPKCGCEHYTVISGRRLPLYQCSKCHHQTTATSATIMANTKLPLVKWFLALYFAATNKNGVSEIALAKYIDVTLRTAWHLLNKIRLAMGERENCYKLSDCVEMDEAFFGGKKEGKRG